MNKINVGDRVSITSIFYREKNKIAEILEIVDLFGNPWISMSSSGDPWFSVSNSMHKYRLLEIRVLNNYPNYLKKNEQ